MAEDKKLAIVNDLNKLTSVMCHCERSEAPMGLPRPPHPVRGPRNDYFSKSFTIDGQGSTILLVAPQWIKSDNERR